MPNQLYNIYPYEYMNLKYYLKNDAMFGSGSNHTCKYSVYGIPFKITETEWVFTQKVQMNHNLGFIINVINGKMNVKQIEGL